MTDVILEAMNAPVQLWIALVVFFASFGILEFLVVSFIWNLPRAQQRILAKIAFVALFFPLIFLFLMCTTDPDD